MHLVEKMQKKHKNLKKADLEILIVKNKLEVGTWPQVNCVSFLNNITKTYIFCFCICRK